MEYSLSLEDAEPENQEPEGEFCFETDHLALRGNKDYCELLKYIVELEAQKIQVLNDIENLSETRNSALDDPFDFVKKLQSGELNFPPRQTIGEMPNIDWNGYGIDTLESEDFRDIKSKKDEFSTKVRGKKFTDNKPETFNQLWSCEEQKRLEELLEIYPEEAVEARRYKKIAEALGTRTPIQVMSRLQKYFNKLAKAGLPVPGRAPKRVGNEKNKSVYYKKTTFFPQLHVPVKMEDPSDVGDTSESVPLSEVNNSDKYMLELLKAARDQRLLDETSPVYQSRTMCVGCLKTGFLGARWTDNAGTDYCTDCLVRLLPAERLIPVRQPVEI